MKKKDVFVTITVAIIMVLSFVAGAKMLTSTPPFVAASANTDISDGITSLTISFLAIVTLFDLFEAFGWSSIIPSFIINAKRKKLESEITEIIDNYYGNDFSRFSQLLEAYFKQDHIFAKSCDQSRINYILHQLGIKKRQYDDLLDGLARMRAMDLSNQEAAINRIKQVLKKAPNVVVCQDVEPADRTNQIKYYIDFISIVRDKQYREEISKTFAFYIKTIFPMDEYKRITKIVIPSDGNFLLGYETGEILELPQVFIKSGTKGQRSVLEPWDGKLEAEDCVIIVYDVLATGEQILDAIEKINKRYPTVEVLGAICIVCRTDPTLRGKEVVQNKCTIYSMVELNDGIIAKEYYHGECNRTK